MKPVLFVIVDALAAEVIVPAMNDGKLPTMKALSDRGIFREECTSIFPSITPAATAALATGEYPCRSGIPGAFWFDRDGDQVAYYGDDWQAIRNEGVDAYLRGFLTGLNYDRLKTETVFGRIERDAMTAANLNLMWFRGPHPHELNVPKVFEWATSGELPEFLRGPDVLVVGDFVRHDGRTDTTLDLPTGGLMNRYGFNDTITSAALDVVLAPDAEPPNLTVAYFPDNDFESHDVGPEAALHCVEAVDATLARLVDRHGGLDAFLDKFAFVMTGDHSQTRNRPPAEAAVDIDALTPGFSVVSGGGTFASGNDVLVGTNMRSANAYFRDAYVDRGLFIQHLLKDDRIDQAVWRDVEADVVRVRTADRGELIFWADDAGYADEYGGRWAYEGNLETVDGRVDEDARTITFGEYPNAFERLDTGCFPLAGDLWVTVRPGYEFIIPETSVHEGGSHGSLHRLDSVAPLISVGLDADVPQTPRIVDVVPMVLRHLGVESPFEVGVSRQTTTEDRQTSVAAASGNQAG